jgi:hypothetical protein
MYKTDGVFMLMPFLRFSRLLLPILLATIAFAPRASAEDRVLKVGTLKLIHGISAYFYERFAPAGYTVEVCGWLKRLPQLERIRPAHERRAVGQS